MTATKPSLELDSMHIEQEIHIQAEPARVFDALTKEISAWWGQPYLQREDARDIRLEARLGGRMFEDWGDGAGVLYATVVSIRAGEELTLEGPFGMDGLCMNRVQYALAADRAGGTVLRLSHRGFGEIGEERRAAYRGGWEDLLCKRLVAWVERKERMGLGHEPAPFGPGAKGR